MARGTVNRRAADGQADAFAGDRANAFTTVQDNLAAVVKGHAGENQHPMSSINVIAAVLANGGNPLLTFHVRRLYVQVQRDARRRDDRYLVNQVLTHHH